MTFIDHSSIAQRHNFYSAVLSKFPTSCPQGSKSQLIQVILILIENYLLVVWQVSTMLPRQSGSCRTQLRRAVSQPTMHWLWHTHIQLGSTNNLHQLILIASSSSLLLYAFSNKISIFIDMWALAAGGIVYVSFLLSSSVALHIYWCCWRWLHLTCIHTCLWLQIFSLEQQKFKFSIYPKEEQGNLKSVHKNTHLTLFY